MTLIRIASGEAWHDLMISLSRQNGKLTFECDETFSYEEYSQNSYKTVHCGQSLSLAYFFSYLILVKLVFLNLFIAIILEGFEDTVNSENKLLNNEKLAYFFEKWHYFDHYGKGKIAIKDLKPFLFQLGAPIGFDESYEGDVEKQDFFISDMSLKTYDNFRNFYYVDIV